VRITLRCTRITAFVLLHLPHIPRYHYCDVPFMPAAGLTRWITPVTRLRYTLPTVTADRLLLRADYSRWILFACRCCRSYRFGFLIFLSRCGALPATFKHRLLPAATTFYVGSTATLRGYARLPLRSVYCTRVRFAVRYRSFPYVPTALLPVVVVTVPDYLPTPLLCCLFCCYCPFVVTCLPLFATIPRSYWFGLPDAALPRRFCAFFGYCSVCCRAVAVAALTRLPFTPTRVRICRTPYLTPDCVLPRSRTGPPVTARYRWLFWLNARCLRCVCLRIVALPFVGYVRVSAFPLPDIATQRVYRLPPFCHDCVYYVTHTLRPLPHSAGYQFVSAYRLLPQLLRFVCYHALLLPWITV